MEKYLNGRIAAYAHLFTEISPPIPQDQKGRFCVNGVLLPGYTVEAPERTPQEVADDLLSLLEDGDLPEQSEGGPLHRRLKKRDHLLKSRQLPRRSATPPKEIQKPYIKRNRSP